MPTLRSLTISFVYLASLSGGVVAQERPASRFTLGGGFGFQDDARVRRSGVHMEGAYAIPLVGRRLEAHLEGGVLNFPGSGIAMTCGVATVCESEAGRMTVLRGGASLVFVEQSDARGAFYWIAGLAAYRVTDLTSGDPYTRLGWNAGFGVRFGRSAFAEIRYHEASGTQAWRHLTPVTIGWRF